MPQDVLIKMDKAGLYDIQVSGGDIASVDGLEAAIATSLFSDARAPENLQPDPALRRGWVGDILTADTGRKTGSLLWILDQARLTDEMLNTAALYAQEALQWLIDDGVATRISASVERAGPREFMIVVNLVDASGRAKQFSNLWRQTNAANLSSI